MFRTQRRLNRLLGPKAYPDLRIESYISFPQLWPAVKTVAVGLGVEGMAKFESTRNFLLKHPDWFTLGYFTNEGPSRQQEETCRIKQVFVARSWKEEYPGRVWLEDVRVVEVLLPDSGYLTTAICAVQCAETICHEADRLMPGGGVMTPAFAFGNTTLRQKLQARGIGFRVVKGNSG